MRKPQKDPIKRALLDIIDTFEEDDQPARESHLRQVRKADLFWFGFQDIFWDWTSRTWHTLSDAISDGLLSAEEAEDYDKNVNNYRAYGEAIVSASSLDVPKTQLPPLDADKIEDVVTSQESDKVAELIQRQNDAVALMQRTFATLYRQHFAAGYVYVDEDRRYGTYEAETTKSRMVTAPVARCVNCKSEVIPGDLDLPTNESEPEPAEPGSLDYTGGPDLPEEPPIGSPEEQMPYCPQCDSEVDVEIGDESYREDYVEVELLPKKKICVDIYGTKNVKVPSWAAKQRDCMYLVFEKEVHLSQLRAMYPKHAELIKAGHTESEDESWARTPINRGESSENETWPTHKLVWLRPEAYWNADEDDRKKLEAEYPEGVCFCVADGRVLECWPSRMDDHWLISEDPTFDTIHADPVGQQYIKIQELENDLLIQSVDVVKHAISEIFVNPQALNLAVYGKQEAYPGMVTAAKPRAGQTLSGEFYETRGATMPQALPELQAFLERKGQFVIGALPEIWGGAGGGGSETLGEASMRREMALQRLAIKTRMVRTWFPQLVAKGVRLFLNEMEKEGGALDTSYSKKNGPVYDKVAINPKHLSGKLGEVMPEASPTLPLTWEEQRAVFFDMLGRKIPEWNATIFHPENITLTKSLIGVKDLFVPGELDRDNELLTIIRLVTAQPEIIPANPMTGQPAQIKSTEEVNAELDDHGVCIQTLEAWIKSRAGQVCKTKNPQGYANVLAHRQEHLMAQELQMQQAAMKQQQQPPPADGQGGDVEPVEQGTPQEGEMTH